MLQCISQPGVLPVSSSLRLLPLYILALLKSSAFTPRYRYSGIFYIAYKLLVRYMLVGTGVRSLVLDFFLPLSDEDNVKLNRILDIKDKILFLLITEMFV